MSRLDWKYPNLIGYKVSNLSILSSTGNWGQQPIHNDLKHQEGGAELFGILMLSEATTKGTIWCNMTGIPESPTIGQLKMIWKDLPPSLLKKLEHNLEARQRIAD
jgi:hypothetical protein